MSNPPSNLSQLLRAKLAPSKHTLALLALTAEPAIELLDNVRLTISELHLSEVRALHSQAPQLVDQEDLITTTRAVYLAVQRQVPDWVAGCDTFCAKFAARAEVELAQATPHKARLAKLQPAHQQYYWDALSGVHSLRRQQRTVASQCQQLTHALCVLCWVLTVSDEHPELVTPAYAAVASALATLSDLERDLDDIAYGLERDAVSARGYLVPDIPAESREYAADDELSGTSDAQHAQLGAGSPSRYDDTDDDHWSAPSYHPSVNPTTGLPMIGETYIDVGGNAFGTGSFDGQ